MARRKKGRPVHGWVIIDKPAGPSSTAVVGKVRWAFEAQKAGHAGTLDPEATGLLAIALGEATKTIPYVTDALKAYDFTVRFGQATNTDDAEGKVTATSDNRPSAADITATLPAFTGDIEQVPPAFSAVKIDGERAYKRARDGDIPTLAARPLFVESLTLLEMLDTDHARLEMVCGKGGYVRAIARDLGETLGCFGHVRKLRRTWSGPFSVDQSTTLEDIEATARTPDIAAFLQPIDAGIPDLPHATVSEIAAGRIRNGNAAEVTTTDANFGETALAVCKGTPLAIGTYRAGMLDPTRVFNL